MDFKDILEKWENSPQGKEAVGDSRFSHILREKGDHGHPGSNTNKGFSKIAMKRMPAEDSLDLHGYTSDEARLLAEQFIHESFKQGYKKVIIIHGRGLHSADGKPILKDVVEDTLRRIHNVYTFTKASQTDGGSGALWVFLRRGIK